MTPERHQQISELYDRALEVAPDRRSAFLAEACAGDEALGAEVASLLAARAEAPGFLSMPALHIAAQELAASRPSTPLRAIGPYEIRALLGRGGMGEVYRAHDTRLGRDVALKLLPAQLALDPRHMARFEREARLVASLNHPNIAAVYGIEEESGRRALVLELVDGATLAERLTSGPVAVHDARAIARQIADALEAAHDRGIVHRDLKPGNVMLRPDGAVKVLDFGLAKALDPAQVSDPALRQVTTRLDGNAVMGTPAYMSPEQVRGMPVDQRSDIWGFGAVLYEMLTGRRAFDGETSSDMIAALLERTPDWSALPADTPAAVLRLLHRCLEKDPKRRLRHIADVRADLADADGAPPDPVTPGRRPWRARALTRTLASVAVVGLIGAAIAFNGRMQNSARTNGLRQYALLPPDGAAFGSSIVDRTPSFAISPDGHRLAFVASSPSSGARLWARPIDGLTADPLVGTEGAASLFWSPDGLSVGLFADGKLKRVNLAGGAPVVLADASSGSGGTWNRSGDIVYAPTPQGPLWHVPAGGGTPRAVTQLGAGELGHVQPQFLPDGRHFLYLVRAAEPRRGIYVSSLDSPEPKRIVAGRERALYAAPGYLLFLREGRLFGQPFDARRLELSGDGFPWSIRLRLFQRRGARRTLCRTTARWSIGSAACWPRPSRCGSTTLDESSASLLSRAIIRPSDFRRTAREWRRNFTICVRQPAICGSSSSLPGRSRDSRPTGCTTTRACGRPTDGSWYLSGVRTASATCT